MLTVLVICTCDNAFQDARYGLHKRVANAQGYSSASDFRAGVRRAARCTVCGKSHPGAAPAAMVGKRQGRIRS